jgi:hypothetical protein
VVEEKAPSSIVAKKKWARKKGGKLKAKSTKGDIVVGLGKRRLADLTSSGVNQELQTEVSKGGEQKRQLVNMEIDNNKNEEVVLETKKSRCVAQRWGQEHSFFTGKLIKEEKIMR